MTWTKGSWNESRVLESHAVEWILPKYQRYAKAGKIMYYRHMRIQMQSSKE